MNRKILKSRPNHSGWPLHITLIIIRPGEGKIIEANGQKAGAYRDEQGTLHVVDTTCTHMGCELSWNPAEKSWDCPCHGSRFSYEGGVIEGPALRSLDLHDVNTIEKLVKDDF
ncbi:Rieske (2Fe-2S) iron-sulfur domain-containing protein [Pseudobacteroides cellulosolvens ATCC 35603 = DSM 2933]|uniref:Rieske (2Fe-2S) iron-sulfur domain-containing protein n=1 Tax=Pseudobacteroides cellulosolvens ATCC 35603 = DSM 2933 TaxID=398512 RepID=A0A0L6JJM3_9FIRM|nr:Rieske (2Fe-2S) iron-sulfur domain-containing protein [Pseudobacteroides cellulosolvens ATCC 35603 = DSM 2933]